MLVRNTCVDSARVKAYENSMQTQASALYSTPSGCNQRLALYLTEGSNNSTGSGSMFSTHLAASCGSCEVTTSSAVQSSMDFAISEVNNA